MVDDHDVGLAAARPTSGSSGTEAGSAASLEALARLRFRCGRHRADHARAAGERRQVVQPSLAEHGCAIERFAPLRHCADDFVAQRLHQTAEFLDARRMGRVIDAGKLNADEDGVRDGTFGFHSSS